MNNLLSYCGLVDPRISASDKDLPVTISTEGADYVYNFTTSPTDFKTFLRLYDDAGVALLSD